MKLKINRRVTLKIAALAAVSAAFGGLARAEILPAPKPLPPDEPEALLDSAGDALLSPGGTALLAAG